jgi:hypothetical protein
VVEMTREEQLKALGEQLALTIVVLRCLYETHTANHPDDQVRIKTLKHLDEIQESARSVLNA